MPTRFFEQQDTARRNTKWLMRMFALAVVGIVATTVVVTAAIVYYNHDLNVHRAFEAQPRPRAYPWEIPAGAGLATLALIGGGSLFKIAQLSSGGTGIAERLGGRRVFPNTTDLVERRLLNVVEEMALASGVPVPPVFLLSDEQGINAFAAGFSPSDAVIGVTRGCAEQLTRDQLQGVVAHEFSHILNGDMRLNLRLIGVLHGLLLLGLVGRQLLYIGGRSGGGSRRGGGVVYLALIGLAVMILGFLGTFIGNLIKAAASRQREFLADASAVQFTRNPEGIGGALKRIGAAVSGSRIRNAHAAEASHMYFAQGVWEGLTGLMATHPPLPVRIRRLDPQWDGKFPKPRPGDAATGLASDVVKGLVREHADMSAKSVPVAVVEHAAEQVADPTELHRQYVHQLVAAIPAPIVDAAHEPYGARALIYATLLDRDPQIRTAQLADLQRSADPAVFGLTQKLLPDVDRLDVRARLPLVDMSLPALRALSARQYQTFARCFAALVNADKRVSLFEWTLHQVLLRHLRSQFEPTKPIQVVYYGLQRLAEPCSVLLSTLARASRGNDRAAFDAGARHIDDVPVRLLPAEACGLNQLHESLKRLAQVAPKQRERLVDACAATICADAEVTVEEAELLRAICDMLDCPMPPLVAGLRVAPANFPQREPSRA